MLDAPAAARIAKLDEVLRNLPSQYSNRGRLRTDVADLLRTCATLQPSLQTFSSGGRSVTLFYLSGVMPICYNSSTYNIPVTVYFDPPFPAQAPRVFVTPTSGMAVRPNHANVDAGGMVYIPYLTNWNARSTLAEMIATIASVFSAAPPVYATAGAPAQTPVAQATVVAAPAAYLAGRLSTGPQLGQAIHPVAALPVVQARPVVEARPVVQARPVSEKEQALQAVTEQAQQRWPQLVKPLHDEMGKQLQRKVDLEFQATKVDEELKVLKAQIETNARHEAELNSMEAELRGYVEAHAGEEPDPDKLRDHMDLETQQVLDCLAEELALEELLVAFDELLAGRKIGIDDFMREVRDVSRRQFMCRVQRQKAAAAVAAANGEPLAPDVRSIAAPAFAAPLPTAAAWPVGQRAPAGVYPMYATAPVAAVPLAAPAPQHAPARRQPVAA